MTQTPKGRLEIRLVQISFFRLCPSASTRAKVSHRPSNLSSRAADLPVASQGNNYTGNKSFGCPIQAVFWLEWATMPPPIVCHPSAALRFGRDDKFEGRWLTLARVEVDGQSRHYSNQPNFACPRSLQRIQQVAPSQNAVVPLIWTALTENYPGRYPDFLCSSVEPRSLVRSRLAGTAYAELLE